MWGRFIIALALAATFSCRGREPGELAEGEGDIASEGEGEAEVGEGEGEAAGACVVSSDCAVVACFEARCLDDACVYVVDHRDVDDDGFDCPADCNDDDADVSPRAVERCDNGVDDDCDRDGDADDADCGDTCFGGWCFATPVVDDVALDDAIVIDGVGWLAAGRGVVRFDDGRFVAERLEVGGRGAEVDALWGSGPGDLWAAGRDLAHHDGVSWSVVEADVDLVAIDGSGADDVWALGAGGLRHFDGTVWTVVDVGAADTLSELHIDALGRVVVAGVDDVLRGGLDGFETVHRFRDGYAGIQLSDVGGELYVLHNSRLFRESRGFTTHIASLGGWDDLDLLVLSPTEVLVADAYGVKLFDGDDDVDLTLGDPFAFERPEGPFHLSVDGDSVYVVTRGGRMFRGRGRDFHDEVTPLRENALPFRAVSAIDDGAGGSIAWALRGDNQLWQRHAGSWELVDVEAGAATAAVVAVSADEAWLIGPYRTVHWLDGVATELAERLYDGCAAGDSAWALDSDRRQLVRLTAEGVVPGPVPPNQPTGVVCPGADEVWVTGLLGLARRRPDGTFAVISAGRVERLWSLGDEVRMPLGFGREVRITGDADRNVEAPDVTRYAGRAAADHWRVERDVLVHVRGGSEHRAPIPAGYVSEAQAIGDAVFLQIDNRLLRYSEADGYSVVDDDLEVQRLVLRAEDDGVGLGASSEGLVRWDGAGVSPFGPAGNNGGSFVIADDGDVWVQFYSVSAELELVHLDPDGAVLERFAGVGGAVVARGDDDVWTTAPVLRHKTAAGFVDVEIDGQPVTDLFELERLDDGVIGGGFVGGDSSRGLLVRATSAGAARIAVVFSVAVAAPDVDGSFVVVDEYARSFRVAGDDVGVIGSTEAEQVLGDRAAVLYDGVDPDGWALRQLVGGVFVDFDTTFPIRPREQHTTPAGVQHVVTQRGGLLWRDGT